MVFKYSVEYITDSYDEITCNGVIFAEDFRQAANNLLSVYCNSEIVRFSLEFCDEGAIYEFEE